MIKYTCVCVCRSLNVKEYNSTLFFPFRAVSNNIAADTRLNRKRSCLVYESVELLFMTIGSVKRRVVE